MGNLQNGYGRSTQAAVSNWSEMLMFSPLVGGGKKWRGGQCRRIPIRAEYVRLMGAPIEMWVSYTLHPLTINDAWVRNPTNQTLTLRACKSDSQWVSIQVPPSARPIRLPVTRGDFTITVDADGEIDVCPNIEVF